MHEIMQESKKDKTFYDYMDHSGCKFLFTMVVGAAFVLASNVSANINRVDADFTANSSAHVQAQEQVQAEQVASNERYLTDDELKELSVTYSGVDKKTIDKAVSLLLDIDASVSNGELMAGINS